MSLTLYGVSAELEAVFEGLRESPGINGYKYQQKDIDALAQMILCRNYGKATLELSYLLFAITLQSPGNTQQAWLDFFWLKESITPPRFRHAFDKRSSRVQSQEQSQLQLTERGLTLSFPGQSFTIQPSRVKVLASLLELIVYIDPSVLKQDVLFGPAAGIKEVKMLATTLQSLLYDYLGDHLQAAQQQRRFRRLWAWLSDYQRHTSSVDYQVTDSAVLGFWQQAALEQDDSLGFRRYRTVAENFFDLRLALECTETQQKLKHSAVIGYDNDAGEISPERVEQALESIVSPSLDIASLSQSPKFLTTKQVDLLLPAVQAGTALAELPLTVMRMRCFGDWQAIMVQALRAKKQGYIKELLTAPPLSYDEYHEQMQVLEQQVAAARDSGLHLLLQYQEPDAMALLMLQLSQETLTQLREVLQALPESMMPLSQQIVQHWPALLLQVPLLNHVMQNLQSAFKANNRQGFKQHEFKQQEPFDSLPYLNGVKQLDALLLGVFNTALPQNENFTSDLSIFRDVFTSLYGDRL